MEINIQLGHNIYKTNSIESIHVFKKFLMAILRHRKKNRRQTGRTIYIYTYREAW